MQFHSERLVCELITEADRADFCSLYQDPKVMRKIGPVMSDQAVERWFDTVLKKNSQPIAKQKVWRIAEKQGQRFVGIQSLSWDTTSQNRAEIGIILGQRFVSQGIGFEAVESLIKFANQNLSSLNFRACVEESNVASEKLFRKLGFVFQEKSDNALTMCFP